ncbi:MAG: hypothetical protein CVU34_07170 [Betaproteobacteria bacterium HGW-Betaproteobacteria-7]|jgi:hypothetical protein|nr:MAG: hypothetical protein CVU34_07170 [Betaproteobacteria bacterium HGW-Betaproteobacteria-7]
MATPTLAETLKFANLQMAAEALFGFDANRNPNQAPGDTASTTGHSIGLIPIGVLTEGNRHASKFTQTEAEKFVTQWAVVDHISNTPTGFSGTLFRALKDDPSQGIVKDQLVLTFRSTEFIDDAARDNEATNKLEIKEHGWAFGQLSDMEAWYQSLKVDGVSLSQKQFSVLGYSLAGHLATAFNLMHGLDSYGGQKLIQNVVTFNGAGVGKIGDGSLVTTQVKLPEMIQAFSALRTQAEGPDGLIALLQSDLGRETYQTLKTQLASGATPGDSHWGYIEMKMALVASTLPFSNEAEDYGLLSAS